MNAYRNPKKDSYDSKRSIAEVDALFITQAETTTEKLFSMISEAFNIQMKSLLPVGENYVKERLENIFPSKLRVLNILKTYLI